ncbi:MAG TPA: hypothetical protein VES69_05235 [Pyrinomonadaceae bacterium]|nr:hypothetical protein [Pyrinomonadaceae bacterium]
MVPQAVHWVEWLLLGLSDRSIGYRKWFCGLSGLLLGVECLLVGLSDKSIGYCKWFYGLSGLQLGLSGLLLGVEWRLQLGRG